MVSSAAVPDRNPAILRDRVGSEEHIHILAARRHMLNGGEDRSETAAAVQTGQILHPLYIAACLKDELAPAAKTKRLARGMPNVTVKVYDCGHFAICFDDFFEEASRDYIAFFDSVLGRPSHRGIDRDRPRSVQWTRQNDGREQDGGEDSVSRADHAH